MNYKITLIVALLSASVIAVKLHASDVVAMYGESEVRECTPCKKSKKCSTKKCKPKQEKPKKEKPLKVPSKKKKIKEEVIEYIPAPKPVAPSVPDLAQASDFAKASTDRPKPEPIKEVVKKNKVTINKNDPALDAQYELLFTGLSGFGSLTEEDKELVAASTGTSGDVYGQITLEGMKKLFSEIPLTSDTIFVDAGCGIGPVIAFMYLYAPIAQSIGVELCSKRVKQANTVIERMEAAGLMDPDRVIKVYQEDILKYADWGKVDVAYMCATCFDTPFMHKFMELLAKKGKPGLIFLTLKELPDDFADFGFVLVKSYLKDNGTGIPMSWQQAGSDVYWYQLT